MATIEKFEDIEAWKSAREFANNIFKLTLRDNFRLDYSLVNQIKSSSGSAMDNIAEGFERDGRKEFIQFLSIAKGSVGETRSQLYRAFDRKYITEEEFNIHSNQATKISKMLSGLITYLRTSENKGIKYKTD